MDDTVGAVRQLADGVSQAAQRITELEATARQIGEIVDAIGDIADQTNLLALNAAIKPPALARPGAALPWWPTRCASCRKPPSNPPSRSTPGQRHPQPRAARRRRHERQPHPQRNRRAQPGWLGPGAVGGGRACGETMAGRSADIASETARQRDRAARWTPSWPSWALGADQRQHARQLGDAARQVRDITATLHAQATRFRL